VAQLIDSERAETGGARFGRYRLGRQIGQGGMAEVFLAYEREPSGEDRAVVLKRIRPEIALSPDFITMFLDEARLAGRLDHPNVARTFEYGQADGLLYMAMEYVRGTSVSRLIMGLGQEGIAVDVAVQIVLDVLEGLHYAHELRDESGQLLGVVHRDVSPQNIVVSEKGIAKLIDFGVARAATQVHVTGTRRLKGKLAYIAPEILSRSSPDRRADLFAVGVVLHEMITGRSLFTRESEAETVRALRDDEAPSLVPFGAPPELEAIVGRALEKGPEKRYGTALEMRDALARLGGEVGMTLVRERVGSLVAQILERQDVERSGPVDTLLDTFGESGNPTTLPQVPRGRRRRGTRSTPAAGPPASTRTRRFAWTCVALVVVFLGSAAISAVVAAWSGPGSGATADPGTGRVSIDAKPRVRVTVGDRDLGETPLVGVTLPAGAHTLRLVDSEGRVHERRVMVPRGRQTPFLLDLRE
jgi:serine/threonine protein kinase